MTALKIRKAIEPDVPQLLPLMHELAEFEKYADAFAIPQDILREQGFRRSPPDFYCLVAEESGRLTGLLVYYFVAFTYRAKLNLVVKELYVAAGHRSKGAGKLLMKAVAQEAERAGRELSRASQFSFLHSRRFFRRLIEELSKVASFAILPRPLVPGIARNQRQRDRRFRVNHLLGALIDFAPRVRLLQRGTAEGAVTRVRHRDLHSVFVHPDVETEIIAGHYRVLREIFRDASADHEQSALFGGDFNFCQLKKILGRIDTEMLVRIFVLMMNQTEAGAAIAKSRAKDRYVFLECSQHDRLAVFSISR